VSPWTTLPAELREQIYAYVLTEPSGLSYHTRTDGVTRFCARERQAVHVNQSSSHLLALFYFVYNSISAISRGAAIAPEELGFNQNQYVSRRCYEEAHGLEFRYNNVLFEDSRDVSAGQRCRVFVNRVVKRNYAQYLSLSIRGSSLFPAFRIQQQPYHASQVLYTAPKSVAQVTPSILVSGKFWISAFRPRLCRCNSRAQVNRLLNAGSKALVGL
jgi:hypothetical protein